MRKLLIIISIFRISLAYAQQKKPDYQFSADLLKEIESDTTAWRFQLGSTALSFSGYHQQALLIWLKNGVRQPNYIKKDSLFYSKSKKLNAKDYIINRSKDEEIIIINEAHHNPIHRVFTASLLKDLYKNGYRYLGLEALADSAINGRKFATLKSGYYTKEPEFGNFIAEAIKIGFKVFGYEAGSGKNGKEREIEQARNIENFIKTNPKGKLIIHCGFSHVFENDYPAWEKAMAGRVKEYLHINPFTIDQELYTERGGAAYNPLFVNLNQEGMPIVLIDQDGRAFEGPRQPKQTDIVVIHPVTSYVKKKPNWLVKNRKVHHVDSKGIKLPILALAYRKGEFDNEGIPADIAEITEENHPDLYLKPSKYQIVLKDKDDKIIKSYPVTIK